MALMSIIVDIAANTAKLEEGMQRAQNAVKEFARFAVEAFSIREIVNFTQHALALGESMEHAIAISGATAEGFQKLAYAANLVGVSTEAVASSMFKMERNLSEAGTGGKKQTEALDALGLSFERLKNLKPEEQFELLGQTISELKSPMDQARAAHDLFGRSIEEMLPLFKKSADEMKRMKDSAPLFTEEELKNLERANESIKAMNISLEHMGTILVGKVSGPIAEFANAIKELAQGNWYKAGEAVTRAAEKMGLYPENYTAKAWNQAGLRKRAMDVMIASPIGDVGPPGYKPPGEEPFDYKSALEDQLLKMHGAVERETTNFNERITAQTEREVDRRVQYEHQQWLTFFHEIEDIADSGAQAMQASFANFFFDPIQVGFKGLLLDFGNIVRRMLAEAASADLMGALFKGVPGGAGGLFTGFLDRVFNASGTTGVSGSDLSGYSGAVADVLSGMGAASKHAGRGGFAPTYNIDARGADADRIMTMMPGLLNQSAEKAKRDILDAFNRGGYPAPRRA